MYKFVAEFHKATQRAYTMSFAAKKAYRKFANEIADKLNEQWREDGGFMETCLKIRKQYYA